MYDMYAWDQPASSADEHAEPAAAPGRASRAWAARRSHMPATPAAPTAPPGRSMPSRSPWTAATTAATRDRAAGLSPQAGPPVTRPTRPARPR